MGRRKGRIVKEHGKGTPPKRPSDLLPLLGRRLGIAEARIQDALSLAEQLERKFYHIGKSPTCIAAACLYIITRSPQKEIAGEANVSRASIRIHAGNIFSLDLEYPHYHDHFKWRRKARG